MPLRYGMTVRLVQVSKSRHGRIAKEKTTHHGLLLAPGQLYGLLPEFVVVSLLGKGSCVIKPESSSARGELIRAGMPLALARELVALLIIVYGVKT